MKFNDLSVAIIAGGKSIRFGEPKSWAKFRGRRLIEYAVELGVQLADDVFIVNGKTLDYSHLGISTIEDIITDCGPIGGLYTALLKSAKEKVLVMPVDMPYLNRGIYYELLKHSDEAKPLIACSDSGMEPLVSIWYKENLSLLKSFIDKKRFSLREPIKALDAVLVDLPQKMTNYQDKYFININYKEDLKKIAQIIKTG